MEGCSVAQEASWLILDDSSPDYRAHNREVTKFWKRFGLCLAYVDQTVERCIADSLPGTMFSGFFERLVARPFASRSEVGRNLGLLTALSLSPDVIFFVDDDMVQRHGEKCFFHWCMDNRRPDSFIATPCKLGIGDRAYLNRLITVLNRDDWCQFVTDVGFTADPEVWYSPANPLWKREEGTGVGANTVSTKTTVVSGQLMAVRIGGEECLPFPTEFNEDLNWSFLQSTFYGTALLKVRGANVQHLPPCIGHLSTEEILSEIAGIAITRALRRINPNERDLRSTLAERLSDDLRVELRRDLFLLLEVEQAFNHRAGSCARSFPARGTLTRIKATLAEVAARLKVLDSRQVAGEWLKDLADRRRMFLSLRRNEAVQSQIRRVLFDASA